MGGGREVSLTGCADGADSWIREVDAHETRVSLARLRIQKRKVGDVERVLLERHACRKVERGPGDDGADASGRPDSNDLILEIVGGHQIGPANREAVGTAERRAVRSRDERDRAR